jgi:hypothetical protein
MSCVWREVAGQGWRRLTVPAGQALTGAELEVAGVQFLGVGQGADRGVALLVRPGVWARVNGQPVLGGLRVLDRKDEIVIAGARLFFSAESTPQVVPFRTPAGTRPPTCPVCRGPIKDDMQAVQCPGCGRWFHQLDAAEGQKEKPCWTYAPTCRFCAHPTSFAADAAWAPEKEDGRE